MAQHYSTCYSTTACYPPQTVICGGRWEAYDDEKHIYTVYSWRVNRRFSRKIPCLRSHILSHLRLRSFACCVVIVVAFKFSRSLSLVWCVCSLSHRVLLNISLINFSSYDNCDRTHPDKNLLCSSRRACCHKPESGGNERDTALEIKFVCVFCV